MVSWPTPPAGPDASVPPLPTVTPPPSVPPLTATLVAPLAPLRITSPELTLIWLTPLIENALPYVKVLPPSAKLTVLVVPAPTMLPLITPLLMLRLSANGDSLIAPVMVPAIWLIVIALGAALRSIAPPPP